MEQLSVFQIRKMDQERLSLGLPLAMMPGDTLPSERAERKKKKKEEQKREEREGV